MSMDPTILGCLVKLCNKEELQMFERVQLWHSSSVSSKQADDDDETGTSRTQCYLCVGKHNLYWCSRQMDKLVEGKMLSYLDIQKAITDPEAQRFFYLVLSPNRGVGSWEDGGNMLIIESQHREMLLDRIALCWQAEYMFKHFQVVKFPQAKAVKGTVKLENNLDSLHVKPFQGYEDTFKHRGYSFFLRQGFRSASGLKNGSFVHDAGWEVKYNAQAVVIAAGVEIAVHVDDPKSLSELDNSATGADDLRTIAMEYKQALTENLDQFYTIVSAAYSKRMNRNNDIAAWDGWQFLVRSSKYAFACVLFRRQYIPPLCDTAQDIAVLLRCPAAKMSHSTCEVILDECQFVANSLATTADEREPYRVIIQARLDTLQFNEEAYLWIEGKLKMVPKHRAKAAMKFLRSIIEIIVQEGWLPDSIRDIQEFKDVPAMSDPLSVAHEMISDAEELLGGGDIGPARKERQDAWFWRISRYLAFCVDGGILGERFTMSNLVQAVGRGSSQADKVLRNVIEFLLHLTPVDPSVSGTFISISQLLTDPDQFNNYRFNERVMRLLLTENYIAKITLGGSYDKLLATLLNAPDAGIGLRTLVCRRVLELSSNNDSHASENKEDQGGDIKIFVPALVRILQGNNLSLSSCSTAAMVNLTYGNPQAKILFVEQGGMKFSIKQLKAKDDDLTLYTLYLLVNLTKTPHHRSIVIREGGVPLLIDILTSSYQNLRKQKILAELASVIGQLSNDFEIRRLLTDEYPVVPCLLWIFDVAPLNSKLKANLLFALKQLCMINSNKLMVGGHLIPRLLDELGQATPKSECITNTILLLQSLAVIRTNALMIRHDDAFMNALYLCGLQKDGQQVPSHKYGPHLWEKVVKLNERTRLAQFESMG